MPIVREHLGGAPARVIVWERPRDTPETREGRNGPPLLPSRARGRDVSTGGLLLKRLRAFEQARKIVTENLPAIPASPHGISRIQVIEIDASTRTHHLQALAASLDDLHIFRLNRKFHLLTSRVVLRNPVRTQRRESALYSDCQHSARKRRRSASRRGLSAHGPWAGNVGPRLRLPESGIARGFAAARKC